MNSRTVTIPASQYRALMAVAQYAKIASTQIICIHQPRNSRVTCQPCQNRDRLCAALSRVSGIGTRRWRK